ncbi:nitroreductase family deazaflavin-dependent oxidoreductase [Nocardia suismassiliense]|uniref:Nitroreductase family deazaflavin-dependent oxidoreductase n=1 Tax=Nocardia suismassiliense TaxID=2077092 RepID=A0ABW6R3K6_9NOCA
MTPADLIATLGARALQTRWLVRAPIWLYRAGLGFLLGTRALMLEHVGRKSGEKRYVVLEVVDQPGSDEYIVVSGFGPKAQWYRNIGAQPQVRISTGRLRNAPAIATPMNEDDAADALEHYIRHHPAAWKRLRSSIERATGKPVDTLPMVRLRLAG